MWVSGPSSSGKTTTTVKLTERLQQQGLRFLMLNLDDAALLCDPLGRLDRGGGLAGELGH